MSAWTIVAVVVGFLLARGWDWWRARPRLRIHIRQLRSAYTTWIALMQKRAWELSDPTEKKGNTVLLLALDLIVNNSSDESDVVTKASLASPTQPGKVSVDAMIADTEPFRGLTVPPRSPLETRLYFELRAKQFTTDDWEQLRWWELRLELITLRGARAAVRLPAIRETLVEYRVPNDPPGGSRGLRYPPPFRGYEKVTVNRDALGTTYEQTYFGTRYVYDDKDL